MCSLLPFKNEGIAHKNCNFCLLFKSGVQSNYKLAHQQQSGAERWLAPLRDTWVPAHQRYAWSFQSFRLLETHGSAKLALDFGTQLTDMWQKWYSQAMLIERNEGPMNPAVVSLPFIFSGAPSANPNLKNYDVH